MGSPKENNLEEIQVDKANLYREEMYTDLQVASIRQLTPVKADGSVDESRDRMFLGQTHVMTQAGPVPIQARLEAKSLEQALEVFPEAIHKAIEKMVEEVKELQRRESSRIVVPRPGQGPLPGAGPGGPGKIQLP